MIIKLLMITALENSGTDCTDSFNDQNGKVIVVWSPQMNLSLVFVFPVFFSEFFFTHLHNILEICYEWYQKS